MGERVWNEQLEIPDKIRTYKNDPLSVLIPLVIISNTLLIIILGYNGIHIPSQAIMLNVLIVGCYILERLPFRLFINPFIAYTCAVAIMTFSFHTVSGINNEIDKLETSTYKPEYLVEFIKPESNGGRIRFFSY